MSYGVLASKTGHLTVETTTGQGGGDTDVVLDRFQNIWGAVWVPGRLTLTKLHLNYIPHRAGQGQAMLNINLKDITSVEVGGGLVTKAIGLRTARHVVLLRCLGAPALATQIAGLVADLGQESYQRRLRHY